ncbi:hypothetical protein ECANGB1_574 [Enterospora canceri]|uniref:Uncharacterized protein n=1 Tax=Enterospora canceri TaxID=1081671 RepID=A0A1Y1S4A9_9MICR|nr:hypothetical protein ECANGB1_574 [Enterospora canceri]
MANYDEFGDGEDLAVGGIGCQTIITFPSQTGSLPSVLRRGILTTILTLKNVHKVKEVSIYGYEDI